MVFFSSEARALRDRWQKIDSKAVNFAESPFGLTKEGLQDFRGYCVSGTSDCKHIISKQRFEKCDLSFSRFAHCKIINSLFVSCKFYAVDFHSCQVESTPKPNCTWELVVDYQPPQPPPEYFEQLVRRVASGNGEKLLKVLRLDTIQVSDLNRAVVFCLSLKSAPSLESFVILSRILGHSENAPGLIVLDQDDLSHLSEPERQLVSTLFNGRPCGLGEVAFVNGGKVIASDVLAMLPMRKAIGQRIGLLGAKARASSEEMKEERFWEIVDLAQPGISPYSPQDHANRLRAVWKTLSDDELMLFENITVSMLRQIYTFDLATAASTIGTGCGDDSFADFCAALVYRGHEVFYDALKNPEEALLKLEGAHYLLLEGFGYLLDTEIATRPGLLKAMSEVQSGHPGQVTSFGGAPIDDEEEAFQKRFPQLFQRYWANEEYALSGALSLSTDGSEATDL